MDYLLRGDLATPSCDRRFVCYNKYIVIAFITPCISYINIIQLFSFVYYFSTVFLILTVLKQKIRTVMRVYIKYE